MVSINNINLLSGFFKKFRKEKKTSIIKEFMNEPEKFKIEASIENDEIIVKIRRKESK